MKLIISEKQLKLILSSNLKNDEELSEADAPSSPSPSAGSSSSGGSTGGGATGYPNVDKWESGVTRGPGNQIDDNVKWADVLKITRGKGNPLT
jgi:hypothetical protein